MIVDTSAFVAMAFDEAEGPACLATILDASVVRMSAAGVFEASIVVDARGSASQARRFDRFRHELGIQVEPVTASQADLARAAYREFGRGSGHPARLNFGDCFAYALAIERDEPLLWIGDDFGHTDVRPALSAGA